MQTIPISTLQRTLFQRAKATSITAITRGGRFVGVLISAGDLPEPVARQLQAGIRHNTKHTISRLTNMAGS